MPTTDDLVVSLTIRPTSNLGRLQKQLESLVGRHGRGVGAGIMYLKRDMNRIKDDIGDIKSRMRFIAPIVTPASSKKYAFAATGSTVASQIKKLGDAVVDKLMKAAKGPKERLFKKYVIKESAGEGALITAIKKDLKDARAHAEDISNMLFRDKRAENFLNYWQDLLKSSESEGCLNITLFTKMIKSMPEFQQQFEDLMRGLGIAGKGQVQVGKMKDIYRLQIVKEVIKQSPMLKELAAKQMKGVDPTGGLGGAGIAPSHVNIQPFRKILNEEIRTVLGIRMFEGGYIGKGKKAGYGTVVASKLLGVPIDEMLQRTPTNAKFRVLDYVAETIKLVGGRETLAMTAFGDLLKEHDPSEFVKWEDFIGNLEQQKEIAFELKQIFESERDFKAFKDYMEIMGGSAALITRQIDPYWAEEVEKIGGTVINVGSMFKKMESAGIISGLRSFGEASVHEKKAILQSEYSQLEEQNKMLKEIQENGNSIGDSIDDNKKDLVDIKRKIDSLEGKKENLKT